MSGWQRYLFALLVLTTLFILPSEDATAGFYNFFHHTHTSSARFLGGTHNSLIEENQIANRDRLDRIANDATLKSFQQRGMLVPLPQNNALKIDKRLGKSFRWCRPWVPSFLLTFASDYYKRFHAPLQINSAIRTVKYQTRLQRTNPNAAASYGPMASTHPTGATVDIAKKKMNSQELSWTRQYLLQKMLAYKIHVIEEFHQAVFHIMVTRNH